MDKPPAPKSCLSEILYFPAGCLLQASPRLLLLALVVCVLASTYLVFGVNSDLLGYGRPDFNNLRFNDTYTNVKAANGDYWTISYEKPGESVYSGLVRNATPIRFNMVPFLTHDILVTTADFANPDIVTTLVIDHHFFWWSSKTNSPAGTINLIHAVPASETVYQQLLAVRSGQQVTLRGYEILKIDAYKKSGEYLGNWQDTGCNSLLVNSVLIR